MIVNNKKITVYEICQLIDKKLIILNNKNNIEDKVDIKFKRDIVDSIISGIPINNIIAYEKNGKYVVIDGRKRLESIYCYVNNRFKLINSNAEYNNIYYKDLRTISQRKIQDYELNLDIFTDLAEQELKNLYLKYQYVKR